MGLWKVQVLLVVVIALEVRLGLLSRGVIHSGDEGGANGCGHGLRLRRGSCRNRFRHRHRRSRLGGRWWIGGGG